MVSVGITGLGNCLPETVVTNQDLEELLGTDLDKGGTSDEWILQRTGIKERRVSTRKEPLPILMSIAAKRALKDANLSPRDIDYIIAGTNSTDPMLVPAVAQRVQYLIGAGEITCFDVGAGCTGGICATEVAVRTIRDIYNTEKKHTRILVIGGDNLMNVTPVDDRSSAVILSDGAGAAIFEPIPDEEMGIKYLFNKTDGSKGNLIHYSSGFDNQLESTKPIRLRRNHNQPGYFLMNGREVHKFILRKSSESIRKLITGSDMPLEELAETTIIPHQMNLRSIDRFVEQLGEDFKLQPRYVYTNGITNYGNNSTASTFIGLDETYRNRKLELYDPVIVVAFGAGLSWGGFLKIWSRPKPENSLEYNLQEQREMTRELNEKYDYWKLGLAK